MGLFVFCLCIATSQRWWTMPEVLSASIEYFTLAKLSAVVLLARRFSLSSLFLVHLPFLTNLPLSGLGSGRKGARRRSILFSYESRERGRNRQLCQGAAEQGGVGLLLPGGWNPAVCACCVLSSSKVLSKEKKSDCAQLYRNNQSSFPLV